MKVCYLFIFYLLLTGCHRMPPLSGHALSTYVSSEEGSYRRYFDRKALRPLKQQWPELYHELRRGGIQIHESVLQEDTIINSHQLLYSDMVSGSMRRTDQMDSVPFLLAMDNFLLVYGPPTQRVYNEVPNMRSVKLIHRPFETMNIFMRNFYGHNQYFDLATGRRLVRADFIRIKEMQLKEKDRQ